MKGNLLRAMRSHLARPAPGAVSEHPDANLLGAFAEKSLSAQERTAVARHLADCPDCRETLALAFAYEEEPIAAAPARRPRRWSSIWSWAASTAALCIVCSAVWEYRLQRGTIALPPAPPAPSAANAPGPAAPAPPITTAGKAATAAPRAFKPPIPPPASPRQAEAPPPPPPLAEASPPTGDVFRPVQPRPAPPPPSYQSPGVQSLAAQRPSQQWAGQARESMPAPRAAASGFTMARPAIAGTARAKGAALADTVTPGPHPLWTIASEDLVGGRPRGIVQRSFDNGATWQTVSLDDNVSFRAIASTGSEVWAGGSGGALFRSADSGAHWKRVPFNETYPITAIQIRANGEIHVTAGQDWVSRDGESWTTD